MVMTHKSVVAQKKKAIHVKDDDPRYLKYTYAEAKAANEKLKADREKVEAYKKKLAEESNPIPESVNEASSPVEDQGINYSELSVERQKEISKLQEQLDAEKGPGSFKRKEKIQKQIDALKGEAQS